MTDLSPEEIVELIEKHGREGRQQLFEAEIPNKIDKLCGAFARAESPRVRQVLCNLLASLARPEALPCLLEVLNDPAPEVVAAAADAIGNSAAGNDTPEPIRGLLGKRLLELATIKDPSRQIRSASIYALGLMRFRSALPVLMDALEDSFPMVRCSAAEAFSHIGDRSAVAPLRDRYDREDEPRVKRCISSAVKSLEPRIDTDISKSPSS